MTNAEYYRKSLAHADLEVQRALDAISEAQSRLARAELAREKARAKATAWTSKALARAEAIAETAKVAGLIS